LSRLEKTQDAVCRSSILFHNRSCVAAQLKRKVWTGQNPFDCRREFLSVLDLERGFSLEEQSLDVPEIFHVGTKHDRLLISRRFKNVVSTLRHKRSAHEHDSRV